MDRRARMWLLAAIILLGIVEFGWQFHQGRAQVVEAMAKSRVASAQKATAPVPLAGKKGHLFTPDEVYAFLASAKRAEANTDPLHRCLAYPDPPGSHWSHAAVVAYCHYRFQPVVSVDQIRTLIENGHAAELDRLMAQALHAQQTNPDAPGRLDRTFYVDFETGSADLRPLLEAWKNASPRSAFAYAASGYAYVQEGFDARGTDLLSNTPQGGIVAMQRLFTMGDADLQQAVKLNPGITPAYRAMITAGTAALGDSYVGAAAQKGLRAAPADYEINNVLMWASQPNWGGSLQAMRRVATAAQAHVGTNPMLALLLSEEPSYEANMDNCDCHSAQQLSMYPVALDQAANSARLRKAGDAADASHHPELAVVYFSEALRFAPELREQRLRRTYNLANFDEAQWAVDEAGRLLATAPHDEEALKARGWAYEILNDYKHAVQDFQAALALEREDAPVMAELGSLYIRTLHDWDKGWALADQAIETFPAQPMGWLMRADIQQLQPRPGLGDTVSYFAEHFDHDRQSHKTLLRMRAALALQPKSLHTIASKSTHTAR